MVVLSYEPDAEVWMREMSGVGISDCYQGHEGVRILIAIRGDFVGHGRSSGAKAEVNDGATAVKLSARGLVTWQEWFVEQDGWKRALAAVGLRA